MPFQYKTINTKKNCKKFKENLFCKISCRFSLSKTRFITAQARLVFVNRGSLLALSVLSMLILGAVSPAFAAQLNWDAKTPESAPA